MNNEYQIAKFADMLEAKVDLTPSIFAFQKNLSKTILNMQKELIEEWQKQFDLINDSISSIIDAANITKITLDAIRIDTMSAFLNSFIKTMNEIEFESVISLDSITKNIVNVVGSFGALSHSELASAMGINKSALSNNFKRKESIHYFINIMNDPFDKKKVVYTLSPRGNSLYAKLNVPNKTISSDFYDAAKVKYFNNGIDFVENEEDYQYARTINFNFKQNF